MSRTVRKLPVGKSKKYGCIGYYNHVSNFDTKDINVLKTTPKRPEWGWHERRYGLQLRPPSRFAMTRWYERGTRSYCARRRAQERGHVGWRWVDAVEFGAARVQDLLREGWTYERTYEGWNDQTYDYRVVKPAFYHSWIEFNNPDVTEDDIENYDAWLRVHRLVFRNGHYKDHHPHYARWHRRVKQADHQVERSRRKAELRKLIEEIDWDELGGGRR